MKPPLDDSAEYASLSDRGYQRETSPARDRLDESLRPDLSYVSARDDAPAPAPVVEPRERNSIRFAVTDRQSTGKVEHVGAKDFSEQVLSSDVPVLVDFYADWCGPCKQLAPTLDRIARQTPGAKVVKVNIDHSPQLAEEYGVRSVPTVMVFKGGAAVARNTGLADESKLVGMLGL
jgi:thioredoxin 1